GGFEKYSKRIYTPQGVDHQEMFQKTRGFFRRCLRFFRLRPCPYPRRKAVWAFHPFYRSVWSVSLSGRTSSFSCVLPLIASIHKFYSSSARLTDIHVYGAGVEVGTSVG